MKRSIVLAAILALAGLPVSACATAHPAPPAAAAHAAPTRAAVALVAGGLGAWGRSGPAAKMAVPAWLAICGMRSNNTWPLSSVEFGSVNTGDIFTARLAQCYFSDSLMPSATRH